MSGLVLAFAAAAVSSMLLSTMVCSWLARRRELRTFRRVLDGTNGMLLYVYPGRGIFKLLVPPRDDAWLRGHDGTFFFPNEWLHFPAESQEEAEFGFRRHASSGVISFNEKQYRSIPVPEPFWVRCLHPGRELIALYRVEPAPGQLDFLRQALPKWFEHLPLVAFCKAGDGSGKYLYFNRFAQLNHPRMKPGIRDQELFSPEMVKCIRRDEDFLTQAQEDTSRMFRYQEMDDDQKPRLFEGCKQLFRNPDGTSFFLGLFLDRTEEITRQFELSERNCILKQALDMVPVGVWALDQNRRFRHLLWNHKMEQMTGIPAQTIQGCSGQELPNSAGFPSVLTQLTQTAEREGAAVFDGPVRLRQYDSPYCRIEIQSTTVSGTKQIQLGFCLDKSDQVDLEQRCVEQVQYQRELIAKSELINTFLADISNGQTFQERLTHIVRKLLPALKADQCCFLYPADQNISAHTFGADGTLLPDTPVHEKNYRSLYRALQEDDYIAVDDFADIHDADLQAYMARRQCRGLLAVSVPLHPQHDGILEFRFQAKTCCLSESDIRLVRSTSNLLSLTFLREKLHREAGKTLDLPQQVVQLVPIPSRLFTPDCRLVMANGRPAPGGALRTGEICEQCVCGIPAPPWCPVRNTARDGRPHRIKFTNPNGTDMFIFTLPFFDQNHRLTHIWETTDILADVEVVANEL